MAKGRQDCFVIMPFNKTTNQHTEAYWTKHFKDVLKPHIEENMELKARRSEPLRGGILGQIITALVVSRVVVADLTDHNPNVYWELGIRQSFKHGTLTIAEVGTKLPFDLGGKGTLFYYPKDHLKMAEFYKRFKEAIQDCLANPDNPDSQVLETLSGRGTLFEIFRRDEAMRRLDAMLLEWKTNSDILKEVLKTAKANKKNPESPVYVTRRLRKAAAELLVTERYVDEDAPFFKLVNACLTWVDALNEQLNCWIHEASGTDEWLLNQEPPVTLFPKLQDEVMRARDKLSRKF